jgi:hypothetical protein
MVEFIGRSSMVDVFVDTFTAALIQQHSRQSRTMEFPELKRQPLRLQRYGDRMLS